MKLFVPLGGSILNLIIVEGIPGSGKSTTARFIALQSERNGSNTKLFHESAYQHPILLQETIHNANDWIDTYEYNWRRFLEEHKNSDDTIVVESVLLQAPILHLLHRDVKKEVVLRHIRNICVDLTDFNCTLVYLYQKDPWVGINRMMETRGGEKWLESTFNNYKDEPYYVNRGWSDPKSHLAFLYEYAEVARSAYKACNLKSILCDNSDWDWNAYYTKILKSFGWSYIPDPIIQQSELVKYAGVYRNNEMGLNIHVDLKDDHLIIFGDQRLKVKKSNTFYIDNISIVLDFIANELGEYDQFIVKEKDLVGNHNDEGTRFTRIS